MLNIINQSGGQVTIISPPYHSQPRAWRKGWAKKLRIGRWYLYISNCRMKKRPVRDQMYTNHVQDHCQENKRKLYERQGSMAMNPIIGHLEEIILAPDPWIEFSQNPMWPWQFGNVAIEYGRNDLRRFTKGGPAASHKHDNLSALADAVYCFDITEGRIEG